jgi:hypothetical protein
MSIAIHAGALAAFLLKSPTGPLGGAIAGSIDDLAVITAAIATRQTFTPDEEAGIISTAARGAIRNFASYYGSNKILSRQGLPSLSFRSWIILQIARFSTFGRWCS